MKLTPAIRELVTQIVARNVAAGVEFARSIGFVMPKDFSIGLRFIDDGDWTRLRMRLDDVTHDAIVRLPHLDGRQSLKKTDEMWKAAWERIHADALALAQVWIDKHAEASASIAEEKGAAKAHALLDALRVDDALRARWMDSCRERAKHFTYR